MQSRREFLDTTLKGTVGAVGMATLLAESPRECRAQEAAPLTKSKLMEVLSAVGKPVQVVSCPDGTTVLLLPYGGRVLGIYAPGSEENFYWTHPALASAETARAFYGGSDWQNSGGDRTWLAPEIDIFLPKYPSTDGYWQPRELDPGQYTVENTPDGPRLVNQLSVHMSRSGKDIALRMSKSIGPAPNPLRYEKQFSSNELEYAGYTQFTTLELLEGQGAEETPVGLWNLVQMPHGGELLIPTYHRAEPKIWFGKITSDDLSATEHLIRYKMHAQGEHKLGVRAVATTGRVGYWFGSGSKKTLIVRNFIVNPSGEYVDVPWGDASDLGYSTQACNVNSKLGSFSELEYHIPAIGGKTGRRRCDDAAQVWAFRGEAENIQAAARCLLSPEV